MKLSVKETLIVVSLALALLVIRKYFNFPDLSVALIVVATLLVAILFAIVPLLTANAKRKKYQEWIDHFDGEITFNERGLFITKQGSECSIAWGALSKIELAWNENPFGDPQFGPYCDTDWVLWSNAGNALRITESVNETNSKILVEAFMEFLPDFNFDYAKFNENHKGRLFDLQGGRVTAWVRNA